MSNDKKPSKLVGMTMSETDFAKVVMSLEYPSSQMPGRRRQANVWEVGAGPFTEEQFHEILRRTGVQLQPAEVALGLKNGHKVADIVAKLGSRDTGEVTATFEVKSQVKVTTVYSGGGKAAKDAAGGAREDGDDARAEGLIISPPGAWMDALAGVVFSRRTKERIFDQVVYDYREEMFEAMKDGAWPVRTFIVVARNWYGFFLACVEEAVTGIGKVWRKIRGAG